MKIQKITTPVGSTNWLQIKGPIDEGDSKKFIDVFSSVDGIGTVWLESNGGVVDEGLAISKMIKMLELNTYVEKNCNSICAIMFLSGNIKQVTKKAVIGIHAAYDKRTGARTVSANSVISWYLGTLGYPEELVHMWYSTSPKKILNINTEIAKQLELGFSIIKPVKRSP